MARSLCFSIFVLTMLGGCASVVEGSSQEIRVETVPDRADCSFTRDGQSLGQITTPGVLKVDKTKRDIDLRCTKDGYQPTNYVVHSQLSAATFGNAIFGGPVGLGIDLSNGAYNFYEEQIHLSLTPISGEASLKSVVKPMASTVPTKDIIAPKIEEKVEPAPKFLSDDRAARYRERRSH